MFNELLQSAKDIIAAKGLGEITSPKMVIDPFTGSGYLESNGESPFRLAFTIETVNGELTFNENGDNKTEPENSEEKAETPEVEKKEEVLEKSANSTTEISNQNNEELLDKTLTKTEDMSEEPLKNKEKSAEPLEDKPLDTETVKTDEAEKEELPKEKEKSCDENHKEKTITVKQKSYEPKLSDLYHLYFPNQNNIQ